MSNILGCTNWMPDNELEKPETLLKKNYLNTKYCHTRQHFTFNEEVFNLLNDTYAMQRLFLNNPEAPTIRDIQQEWPTYSSLQTRPMLQSCYILALNVPRYK